MRYHLVINPLAGGGRTGRRSTEILAEIRDVLGEPASTCLVAEPGDAERSTREVLSNGTETVVVVGGDGTIQSAGRGFFVNGNPINSAARLGIVSTGTGRGLAQSLGLVGKLRDQVEIVAEGNARPVDAVRMTKLGAGSNGITPELFINECQFGLGGTISERVSSGLKRLGGRLAFGLVTVTTGLSFRAGRFELTLDDEEPRRMTLLGVIVANGSMMGGGMRLLPDADPTDGMLDVLCIHDMPVLKRISAVRRIYDGSHVKRQNFSLLRCRRITVRSGNGMAVAADGEVMDGGDRLLEVVHGAIRIFQRDLSRRF